MNKGVTGSPNHASTSREEPPGVATVEASLLEMIFAGLIVVVLISVALYYGPRQWQTLGKLRTESNLDAADRRYIRRQAWRRLINSALMLLLAALLVGSYIVGQERQAAEMGARAANRPDNAASAGPSAEQERFLNRYSTTWILIGLLLLAILCLAFADLWAIRSFGIRHYRKIQADRREVIQREVARLRSQRNGH
jgi:hypothetical protein